MPPRNYNSGPSIPPPPAGKNSDRQNPPINTEDLCVGCIIWLPPKDSLQVAVRCNKESCCENGELDDGGYKHPVIVLSIKQRHGSNISGDLVCCVACVTTFKDTTLSDYLAKRRKKKYLQRSVPIKDPEAADIRSYGIAFPEELDLEKGRRLRKQSYVRLDHNFEVPASMLRQYAFRDCQASKMRLTQKSYTILMSILDLIPEPWHATKSLHKTAKQRLLALADPVGSLENAFVPPQLVINTPIYNPYEHCPPQPYIPQPYIIGPNISTAVRPYNPVLPRTYPTYQQPNNNYYINSGPRWRVSDPEPEPKKESNGIWFFGFAGTFILATLAWWRSGK